MGLLELWFASKDKSLSVQHFTVKEALSSLFEVSVVAASKNSGIDIESISGKPAGFLLRGGPLKAPRVWSGVCSHMEQIAADPGGLSTYQIDIAPSLWLTTRRRLTRIFQHLSIPAIVQKILAEYSIKPTLHIKERHGEHEYKVQHGETDFAFISRLLEEEGISYSFIQVEEGTGYRTQLVLDDKPETRAPQAGGGLPFADEPNPDAREGYVTRVRVAQKLRTGRLVLRDYDFTRPDHELIGESGATKGPESRLEEYRYAPGAFIKERRGAPRVVPEEEANAAAAVALGSLRQTRRQVNFETNAFDLEPGAVIKIEGHPRKELRGKKLLVTDSGVDGSYDGEWTMWSSAAFTDTPFQPERVTPKPVMHGPSSAVVVGPKGEEIHTDEFGRVKVQFHWDRDAKGDDSASCWVRVSQGWAGAGWGMIALPRVGQEVVIDYIEGDPDQPIVIGRMHNKGAPVPYKLPEHKTKSAWKSRSSPGSDGFNEIMFEDKAGEELVYVQAERDLSKLVKHGEVERTTEDRTVVVGRNRTVITAASDATFVATRYTAATASVGDLNVASLGAAEAAPRSTMITMEDGKVILTTGQVTTALDGANISLIADKDVIIKSGGDVIIEGSHVYINCDEIKGEAPQPEVEETDLAANPTGRVLGAVAKVFGTRSPRKKPLAWKDLIVGYRPPTARERRLAATPGTSTKQMMARRKVALDFYARLALKWDGEKKKMRPYRLPEEIREIYSHLTGVDFKHPVKLGPPPPAPATLTQWHVPARKGQYFAPAGTTPKMLGIGEQGLDPNTGHVVVKSNDTYQIPDSAPYLTTTASDKTDTWSVFKKGADGRVVLQKTQKTTGGGQQFFIPDTSGIVNLTGAP